MRTDQCQKRVTRQFITFKQSVYTTINQPTEKCNELNIHHCIEYIDYEQAFDSIENEEVFEALRNEGINEAYITSLKDSYTGVTAGVHLDNQV